MRRPGPPGQKRSESFGSSSVQALLEVTSVVRGERDLKSALATIVKTVAEALEFKTVVLNLYRPEFDDFCVTDVYGSTEARDALLGSTYEWGSWKQLLTDEYRRGGARLPEGLGRGRRARDGSAARARVVRLGSGRSRSPACGAVRPGARAVRSGLRGLGLLSRPERRGPRADRRRSHQVQLAEQRSRAARVEPSLAARAAVRTQRRGDGLHLGGRPGGPPRAVRRAPAGAA